MQTLIFTLIQTQLYLENKQANLKMFEEKIFSIKEKTEIIILPEMFTTGFIMKPETLAESMFGESIAWMKRIAQQKKIILTGSLMIEENSKYFNRLIWMLPNTEYGFYDKRHLFAFGNEDKYFSAGNKRLITSVKGWRINIQVCYDLRFPVWSRQQSHDQPEFDVLIYVANWPEKRNVAWKVLLQARAIENQCYVIGVNRVGKDENDINYSGDSMVIDAFGKILYHKEWDEDIFTIALQKEHLEEVRNKFPFWRDGDDFIIKNH